MRAKKTSQGVMLSVIPLREKLFQKRQQTLPLPPLFLRLIQLMRGLQPAPK